MSTTFGIIIKNGELLDLPPQENGLESQNLKIYEKFN